MKQRKLLEILERNSSISSPEIFWRRSGEHNFVFLLEEEDRKLVAKTPKPVAGTGSLENEYKVLELLKENGIKFVPEAIDFLEEDVLLMEYIDGEEKKPEDLNNTLIKQLARKLARIHSIESETLRELDSGLDRVSTVKSELKKSFERFSRRRYEQYLRAADESDQRVSDQFRKQKALVHEAPEIKIEPSLTVGNLGDLILKEEEIFMIDWEFSSPGIDAGDIFYLFKHSELSPEQEDSFMQAYREERDLEIATSDLDGIYPRFLAFNDMIWAALRCAEGEERSDLLEERMADLEKLY